MKGTHNPFYSYIEWLDFIEMLENTERGLLFTNILLYAKGEELLPMKESTTVMAFKIIKSQLDKDPESILNNFIKRQITKV